MLIEINFTHPTMAFDTSKYSHVPMYIFYCKSVVKLKRGLNTDRISANKRLPVS